MKHEHKVRCFYRKAVFGRHTKAYYLLVSSRLRACQMCLRVMSSKKKPMMLSFKNSDPRSIKMVQILFKNGDDLRQDILTLQLLKVMDQVCTYCTSSALRSTTSSFCDVSAQNLCERENSSFDVVESNCVRVLSTTCSVWPLFSNY